jgi:aspartate dehydrogenase
MPNLTLGLVGLGNIGTFLAQGILDNNLPYNLTFINDVDEGRIAAFKAQFPALNAEAVDLDTLSARSKVIVEAAQMTVVPELAQKALLAAQQVEASKYLFVMSVGGLLNLSPDFHRELSGSYLKILAPSGAIGGMDALAAMTLANVSQMRLTTRKPPKALGRDDKEAVVLYEGPPAPAFQLYPKNVNVAITLALATVGLEKMQFKLISDPAVGQNIHKVEAIGDAGTITMELANTPSPHNPRTSYLAALSIISALKRFSQNLLVGY